MLRWDGCCTWYGAMMERIDKNEQYGPMGVTQGYMRENDV